jgi:hypothetical protein
MKMRLLYIPLFLLMIFQATLSAQNKYFTKSGAITFSATGPIKNIKGENKKGTFLLDPKTGAIQIALLMNAFEFPRAIFQNVDYLESDKYPKTFYKGKITNIENINFAKDGSYPISLIGALTLHGVTKNVPAMGTLNIRNGKVNAMAKLSVNLEEFNVDIPSILANDKDVKIDVSAWFDALAN